jgi:hypothetical protein
VDIEVERAAAERRQPVGVDGAPGGARRERSEAARACVSTRAGTPRARPRFCGFAAASVDAENAIATRGPAR